MKNSALGVVLGVSAGVLASCVPDREDTPYVVDSIRILAIRGTPAEVRPDTQVRYEVLVASGSGTEVVPLALAYCTEARSAEERSGVSSVCLEGKGLSTIAEDATVLRDACSRFGPNAPPSSGDEAAKRPADPDPSGGFYIPIQVSLASDPLVRSFGFHRIRCDLAGATRDIFEAFQEGYQANQHPRIANLKRLGASDQSDLNLGQMGTVTAGASISLQLEVRADSFEDYIVYSAENARLFDRKESLAVSWYVSDGLLESFTQSVPGATRRVSNTWMAPETAGTVYGWVVLRDARGGASWQEFVLTVN